MTTDRLIPTSPEAIVERVDQHRPGDVPTDTIPSGFPSLDRLLGGGLRRRDLVVLGGDVGSGKSALALGIALRVAQQHHRVAYLSGEMDEGRLMERALAIEGRASVDEIRNARLSDEARAGVGAAAVRLRGLPLVARSLAGGTWEQILAQLDTAPPLALVVVDYLQFAPPSTRAGPLSHDEAAAATVRHLKSLALEREVALLAVAQLPGLEPGRADPRPRLDDFGHLGAVKQHADVVLTIYREEMYTPGRGVDGATELTVAKNRGGPTGFVDLYFYRRWMRFEDMLDPDR